MAQWLAIAVYRCEVAGSPTESLDIQVRFFEFDREYQVEDVLRSEAPATYLNGDGESVTWPLAGVLSIQEFSNYKHGDELIGFIAQASEFPKWTYPFPSA